jgi:uncharacterized RDD family membrane protein YckC
MNNDTTIFDEIAPQYTLATTGQRFGNFIIDYIIQIMLFIIAGFVIAIIPNAEGFAMLMGYIFYFAYPIIMEFTCGQTIGKMITKTMVISKDGNKLSLGQCFGRTFARLIPFEAFSALGSDAIMWHDSLPGTYVVQKDSTFVSI